MPADSSLSAPLHAVCLGPISFVQTTDECARIWVVAAPEHEHQPLPATLSDPAAAPQGALLPRFKRRRGEPRPSASLTVFNHA